MQIPLRQCEWGGQPLQSSSVENNILDITTQPFPKPTLTLTSHLRQNNGLGEG